MSDQIAVLTDEERAVLDHLVRAYEAFNRLPVQHSMHQAEFVRGIHECQRLVMSRPVARAEGWVVEKGTSTALWTEDDTGRVTLNQVTFGGNDGEPKLSQPEREVE